MKQRAVAVGTIFLILFIMSKSGVIDAFLIFLLVGAIPGTSGSLPAGFMLAVCVIAVLILVFRFTVISLVEELGMRRLTKKHAARKDRMPKKRFHSISR